MRATRRDLAWLGLAALAVPATAGAQEAWPSRPVRMIVPFPPGGAADLVARMLAAHFQRKSSAAASSSEPRRRRQFHRRRCAREIGAGWLPIGLINIAANAILPAVRRVPLPYHPLEDFAPISTWR